MAAVVNVWDNGEFIYKRKVSVGQLTAEQAPMSDVVQAGLSRYTADTFRGERLRRNGTSSLPRAQSVVVA